MKQMFEKARAFLGRPSIKDEDARPKAPVVRHDVAGILMPEGTIVCRKPDDVPRGVIVSGSDKNAQIQLKGDDIALAVVIRNLKTYTILVTDKVYGSPYASTLFGNIRESLASLSGTYDEKIVWATPEIIASLRDRKGVAANDSNTLSTSENPYAQVFTDWLKEGMKIRATDMHVECSNGVATIRFRVDSKLRLYQNGAQGQVMADIATSVLAAVYNKLSDKGSNTNSSFNANNYFSSTVTYEDGDVKLQLRCQFIPTVDGFDFISRFRVERNEAPPMSYKQMGYTDSQIALINAILIGRRGLIIIAGIPNSGKTSLVQAILTNFPNKDGLKLVTLDDPVEFKVPGVSHGQIKTNTANVEESAKSYMQAMQSWLRGNPDVISLGEIRNSASGFSAITSARVGCLGIATIHANSQMGIYERLTDEEIGLKIRAITSDGIVSLSAYQALVATLCDECALPVENASLPIQNRIKNIGEKFSVDTSKMRITNGLVAGKPCPCCNGSGTGGMKVVAEMYSPTEEFFKALRTGDDFGARDIWLAESDGRFDTDNMTGKPVFLHAFKDALDGRIDFRSCERFGNFDSFMVKKNTKISLRLAQSS